MRVYAVNIVSPPPQALGEFNPTPGDLNPPAVETPIEAPPEPEQEPEPEPEPPARTPAPPAPRPAQAPAPAPARTPPRQEPARQTPAPSPPAARPAPPAPPAAARPGTNTTGTGRPPSTGANPDPTSAGGENINLQMRGVQCPTPEYCNNIVRQVNRYLRPPAGTRGRAEVYFLINRDGSVSGIRVVSSTGGSSFRLSAMEAVEQAGRNRAFGNLPASFQVDQLPVSLAIQPNQ